MEGLINKILLAWICILPLSQGHITWIAVRLPLEGERAPPGSPWPMPKEYNPSPDMLSLDAERFRFSSNLHNCDVVDKAFERYEQLIVLDKDAEMDEGLPEVTSLEVTVTSEECDEYPTQDSDESYELTVQEGDATLTAPSVWGVVRGLETFSQLIFLDDENKYQINATEISDAPRFPFRAFMIDTARHFMAVSVILEQLEVMAWNKINILHWHVVDDQSFPYPMKVYPELQDKGAYTDVHKYSREDVDLIIEEARLRGIRVIPEFDTPGHTYSWGLGLPRLITPCWGDGLDGGPYVPDYPNFGPAEIMNPMEEYVYEVMKDIYEEIAEDFPDDYVHLGMDEVYYRCWESNPNISEWMTEMNFTEYWEVEQYYQVRLIDIVKETGAKYMIWQDPVDNGVEVDSDAIVVVWKETKNGLEGQFLPWQNYSKTIAEKGYSMILSAPWYLNMITYGQDWKEYYMIEPTNFTDVDEEKDLMKGGEMCAWAEYIDGTNFLPRIWPRGSAVAERLWSPMEVNDVDSAQFRLDQQRCRMLRRGVNAQPILPGYCGDYEWGMKEDDDGNGNGGDGGNGGDPSSASQLCDAARVCLGAMLFSVFAIYM